MTARVENLEAISAQPGRIPRAYHEALGQVRGELAFLHKQLYEHLNPPVNTSRPKTKGVKID